MQKKYVIIFAAALVLLGALIYIGRGSRVSVLPQKEMATAAIGGQTFNLEVVRTPEAMAKGLAGRASLGDREGMLFVFGKTGIQYFTMKGMKFPIDIIWLRSGKIVGIFRNIAITPSTQEVLSAGNIPIYPSPDLVDKVIEVRSGTADALNINTGDTVSVDFNK